MDAIGFPPSTPFLTPISTMEMETLYLGLETADALFRR